MIQRRCSWGRAVVVSSLEQRSYGSLDRRRIPFLRQYKRWERLE